MFTSEGLEIMTFFTSSIKMLQTLWRCCNICFIFRFYTVAATCVAGGKRLNNDCPILDPCVKMPWSSFSPDPKSELGLVNTTTGRLN